MPFCPKCGCEYERGIQVCSDDGEWLVEDLPVDSDQAPNPSGNMVMVYSSMSQVEAGLIEGMLESEGIVVGMSNQVGSLMMQYAPPLAGLRIFVHERDEERARELIQYFFEMDVPDETEEQGELKPAETSATVSPPKSIPPLLFIAIFWAWCYWGLGIIGMLIFYRTFSEIFFYLQSPAMIVFHLASSIVTLSTIIYFFIHIKRNHRLSGVEKGLWALGIINLAVIFFPAYLFKEILRDPNKIRPE